MSNPTQGARRAADAITRSISAALPAAKMSPFTDKEHALFVDDISRVIEAHSGLAELVEAAEAFLAKYVQLVDSGDCGNWDADDEPEVVALRAALKKVTNIKEKSDG